MSDRVSEHPNAEKNVWESPAERQNRELLAEVERLTARVKELKGTLLDVFDLSLGGLDEDTQQAVGAAYRAALEGEK